MATVAVAAGVLASSALPSASRRVQSSSANKLPRRQTSGGNANLVLACDGGGELASSSGLHLLGIESAQYNSRNLVILVHFTELRFNYISFTDGTKSTIPPQSIPQTAICQVIALVDEFRGMLTLFLCPEAICNQHSFFFIR